MYVCLCSGITDTQIEKAICDGACCLDCLKQDLGLAMQCGKCAGAAQQMLLERNAENLLGDVEAA